MSMREGCAGFFTEEDLEAGKGIVKSRLDRAPMPGRLPEDWRALVSMEVGQTLDASQVDALRAGDLAAAFGRAFSGLELADPHTIPGGKMKLVHRVVEIDPGGGRFGIGRIVAEADIHPDDWFITCHFSDDPVMPGTLMYECCLHTLRIFLMRQGWVGETGQVVCQPIPGVRSRLKCRGQVLATTRVVTYDIEIKKMGFDEEGTPYAIVDASMLADGKAIVDIGDMSLRMTGCTRASLDEVWRDKRSRGRAPTRGAEQGGGPGPRPALYGPEKIRAFSEGAPSEAFGAPYEVFDRRRKIARLPRAPFAFLDRITDVEGAPFELSAGASCEAQFDVRPDHWYFSANEQEEMPFAVLLEAGLQPCGWLAAYCGSALASDADLKFRNLGGRAEQSAAIERGEDTLTTRAKLTKVSRSGGMIIQDFEFEMWSRRRGRVYEGTTNFGFFSAQALDSQVGLRGAKLAPPAAAGSELELAVPCRAPFPTRRWWMLDHITRIEASGGSAGLGFIEGRSGVDPSAWFFDAHFYEDPVWPGSLGLEAFVQLLKVFAVRRWSSLESVAPSARAFSCVVAGHTHEWQYRGQVVPRCSEVRVQANITSVDEQRGRLFADGLLIVDGLPIYEITQFGIELRLGREGAPWGILGLRSTRSRMSWRRLWFRRPNSRSDWRLRTER
jgi:3-hydroxymyristoyl/3-hydroxydecanoyl-(acyl carrier protein) dehydratase